MWWLVRGLLAAALGLLLAGLSLPHDLFALLDDLLLGGLAALLLGGLALALLALLGGGGLGRGLVLQGDVLDALGQTLFLAGVLLGEEGGLASLLLVLGGLLLGFDLSLDLSDLGDFLGLGGGLAVLLGLLHGFQLLLLGELGGSDLLFHGLGGGDQLLLLGFSRAP